MTLKSRSNAVSLANLCPLPFADVIPGVCTQKAIIKGRVTTAWPVNKLKKGELLKVAIKEENGTAEIIVFVFDENSEYDIGIGDLLKLSNVWIEKATSGNSKHPCQILVDEVQSKAVLQVEKCQPLSASSILTGSMTSRCDVVQKTATKKSKTVASVRKYIYTKLKDVRINSCVDVFGVVKFFKPPAKSRGTDYMMIVSLTDSSFSDHFDKLKCVLFSKEVERLPAVKHVGDIVRFHRLMISEFNSQPQGKNGAGFSWLVFDGNVGSSMEPRASSGPYFTLTDRDRETVKALREWTFEDAPLSQEVSSKASTLSSVVCNQYLDLTCQVVLTCVLSEHAVLLRIWDGTKISMPVLGEKTEGLQVHTDSDLQRRSVGYVYDVKVFDDHCPDAKQIKPGDVIRLRNLHAARYKPADSGHNYNVLPTIEFCLHRGTSYNRGLSVLPADSEDRKQLLLVLSEVSIAPEPESNDSEVSVQSVLLDDLEEGQMEVDEKKDAKDVKNQSCSSIDMFDLEEADGIVENRMTGKVITEDYHHVQTSSVMQVLQGAVPYKYKLRVKVRDFQPRPHSVEQFLRLYCKHCHYL